VLCPAKIIYSILGREQGDFGTGEANKKKGPEDRPQYV